MIIEVAFFWPTLVPLAYIGPGPGLTMLATLVGLLATIAIAISAVAAWPFRVLLRKRREARARSVEGNSRC
jgi:hypothetical protein